VPRPPIRITIHPPTVAEIVAVLERSDRPSRLPADWPRDEHGLPLVEHDPNDPDDDHDGR